MPTETRKDTLDLMQQQTQQLSMLEQEPMRATNNVMSHIAPKVAAPSCAMRVSSGRKFACYHSKMPPKTKVSDQTDQRSCQKQC
jgi:hypothetical protein